MNPVFVRRLASLALFLFILFSLLIVRFYEIQILAHEKWEKEALAQHRHVVSIPFKRGGFYSNVSIKKGHPKEEQPLVIDVPKFHLFIDPESIPDLVKEKMARQLFMRLGFDAKQSQKMRSEFDKKSRSRKIAMWLDRKAKENIETWWHEFLRKEKIPSNALFFTSEYKRSYPFGSLLGAVLHTVQEEKDPKDGQSLPTGGLEMMFHSYLKGKSGKKIVTRSPRHPLGIGEVLQPPEDGADVYLTINHYLQAIAESELQKGVENAKASGGWAVMMDPNTGEVLALAQYPTFDPSHYAAYFNDPSLVDRTHVRAVTDCYEPGSIFKPITLAVCMRANEELLRQGKKPIFTPDEKVPTSNGWFPGRSFPLKDGRPTRFLNMDLAIQKSSDIYVARLIHRLIETLGEEWYRNALVEMFGFGQKTNLEIPAESPGLLPTPGKLHPNGKPEWSTPTPYSLAMGYNILINAVQIVKAYAILANGGKKIDPHIIRKIVKTHSDGSETVYFDHTHPQLGKQILDPAHAAAIVRSMKFATKEGGTSKRADVMGYTEAGKSGTAEKVIDGHYAKDHNISSFLGVAPAKNPRFVLLVSLDDPEKKFIPGVGKHQMGGVCAAPIFREIATKALQYLGATPDDPFGYPVGDCRRNSAKADWHAEVETLKALYDEWNR